MGSVAEAEMDVLGYNRYEARYDADVLDYGCATLTAIMKVIFILNLLYEQAVHLLDPW